MALYRNVELGFWTDSKVDDEFTPEDKYFFLYLLTNPHTNICGCYEISMKQMCRETGYNEDTILRLLKRMQTQHRVAVYDASTKEVLIINWGKHNWTKSDKLIAHIQKAAEKIKSEIFKSYILDSVNSDTLSIPYPYPMDTSITITNAITNSIPNNKDMEKGNRGSGGKREKEKDVFEEFAGADSELLEALNDFEKMRKKIGKPLSDRAKTMLLNKLGKFPADDWVEILEQSVFYDWQGLYPLKDRPASTDSDNVFLSILESGALDE